MILFAGLLEESNEDSRRLEESDEDSKEVSTQRGPGEANSVEKEGKNVRNAMQDLHDCYSKHFP